MPSRNTNPTPNFDYGPVYFDADLAPFKCAQVTEVNITKAILHSISKVSV